MRTATLTSSLLLPASLALMLVGASPAGAATRIGSTTAADQSCGADVTVVQDLTSSAAPSYSVPQGGGIITSWGFKAGANPGTRKLKLMRPTGTSGAYFVGGESAPETGLPNQRNDFRTRIRVGGGELLGFYTTTGDACRGPGPSGSLVRSGSSSDSQSSDPPVGSFFQATSLFLNPSLLEVTADIEADADGDGYGDETQDACPTDREVFATACDADLQVSLTGGPARLRLGATITYTLQATNAGPIRARGVALEQRLPDGAPVVSAPDGCTGFATIRCAVGDLASGQSTRTFTVVVRAPDTGELTSTATAGSLTSDPVAANNTASQTVTVLPPRYGGVRPSRRSVRVVKGAVPLVISCPIAARSCTGTVALSTAARVRVKRGAAPRRYPLGTTGFRVKGGKRRTVRIPLGSAARRYLSGRRSVRALATSLSTDGFSQPATSRVTFAIRSGARR